MSNQGDGQPPQDDSGQQGSTGGQWPAGQPPQPPSWSTGETGPNVGPTMNNPQSSYYDRFSAASGEGVVVPPQDGGGGGKRGKVLIGIAAALVVVMAAVVVFALTRGDDKEPKQAVTATTNSLPPVTATTWVNPTKADGARALQSGWQAQTADHAPGAYDVPKSKHWKVDPSGWQAMWGSAESVDTLAVMNGPAEFGLGYCPSDKKDHTAVIGLTKINKRDPAEAGPAVAKKFAKVLTLDKNATKVKGTQGELSDPKTVKVDQGTIPAIEYTITATPGAPNKCEKGKKYQIRTVTFSAGGQSYQLVAVRLLGVKPELSDADLDDIISTFRPS